MDLNKPVRDELERRKGVDRREQSPLDTSIIDAKLLTQAWEQYDAEHEIQQRIDGAVNEARAAAHHLTLIKAEFDALAAEARRLGWAKTSGRLDNLEAAVRGAEAAFTDVTDKANFLKGRLRKVEEERLPAIEKDLHRIDTTLKTLGAVVGAGGFLVALYVNFIK